MTWTKKLAQFALSCALRPSTKELAAYLMRRGDKFQATEVLIDLREWNSEIAKHRPKGEYDRKTAKDALAQLDKKTYGWFTVMKSYSWAVHEVLVRPVQFALDKKSQSLGKAPKLPTGQPMFDADRKQRAIEQQQQDISTMRSLTAKLGLKFTDDALMRMWRYAGKKISQVTEAIKYMLYYDSDKKYQGQEGIGKPHGFLNECLKYGWHRNWDNYYVTNGITLPSFNCGKDIDRFVRDISPPESI